MGRRRRSSSSRKRGSTAVCVCVCVCAPRRLKTHRGPINSYMWFVRPWPLSCPACTPRLSDAEANKEVYGFILFYFPLEMTDITNQDSPSLTIEPSSERQKKKERKRKNAALGGGGGGGGVRRPCKRPVQPGEHWRAAPRTHPIVAVTTP